MHENFYHKLKIYYEDTDAGGVVYYANYLKYLERARTEALTTIGLSNLQIKEKFGALIIVKSCNIEYKKSAHLEDQLSIRSFVKSNIWALLPAGKSKFKKGEIVDCFFPNHSNSTLV